VAAPRIGDLRGGASRAMGAGRMLPHIKPVTFIALPRWATEQAGRTAHDI
jgi:hypothetical protein